MLIHVSSGDEDVKLSDDLRKAILARLNFRKNFLSALDIECATDRLAGYWPPIRSNMETILSSHEQGKPVEDAFSTKIQRKLASTVPPRPIVMLEFKDAFEKLKQLCVDCEEATRLADIDLDPSEYQVNFPV